MHERKKLELEFPFLAWESASPMFPPHWHDCFEFLFVKKGGMFVSVNDTVSEAAAGSIVLVDSGANHGFFDARPGTAVTGMQFDLMFLGEVLTGIRGAVFNIPVITKNMLSGAVHQYIKTLFLEIADEYNEKKTGWQLAVKAKIYEFILTILRNVPSEPKKTASSKARQVRVFIYKNYDDPQLTLEEAAFSFKLSKFYFIRFFKKWTGYSFHAYLTKTRVEFACRYLMENNMPVTDVAFRSGFNSLQTFNRVFKSQTGFAPRDYRREHSLPSAIFGANFDKKN